MIKVYKYGLQAPTFNADLVHQEIRKGHTYQNKLIEIERWRRVQIREIESKGPNIPELTEAFNQTQSCFDKIDKEIKTANAKARTKVATDAQKKEKLEAKNGLKTGKRLLIDARRSLRSDEKISIAKKEIEDQVKTKQKELRADKNIAPWFGTYMLIDDAFSRTRGMPLYDGIRPNDPRFRQFKGEGRLGIKQVAPGVAKSEPKSKVPIETITSLNPTSQLLQIIPRPPPQLKANGKLPKIGNKNLKLLRLRIGTDETRKPIWAQFPMVYHRPVPPNSEVLVVQVCKELIASRERWSVSITVRENIDAMPKPNDKVVAIDLGWRTFNDRIRIGCWKDSDGNDGEISIPKSVLNKLHKAEEIKSGRDMDFDRAKMLFGSYIKNANITTLPQWFQDWLAKNNIAYIDKWRSQNKLAKLILNWKTNRFAGDENIFAWLEHWRYHDFHLWNWERSQQVKTTGEIDDIYRNIAAKFANNYGTIVFEDINLSNLARGKVGSTARQLTAPSKLRNNCKNAFEMRGGKYEEVSARNTSRECAKCQTINDIGSALEYFCSGCKEELDRDENAAENILARYYERLSGAKIAVTARNDIIANENEGLVAA